MELPAVKSIARKFAAIVELSDAAQVTAEVASILTFYFKKSITHSGKRYTFYNTGDTSLFYIKYFDYSSTAISKQETINDNQ